MAVKKTAKCPKCGGVFFENNGDTVVKHYLFKLNFIQCATCSTVVGVIPATDPGVIGKKNRESLTRLEERVAALEGLLRASLAQR